MVFMTSWVLSSDFRHQKFPVLASSKRMARLCCEKSWRSEGWFLTHSYSSYSSYINTSSPVLRGWSVGMKWNRKDLFIFSSCSSDLGYLGTGRSYEWSASRDTLRPVRKPSDWFAAKDGEDWWSIPALLTVSAQTWSITACNIGFCAGAISTKSWPISWIYDISYQDISSNHLLSTVVGSPTQWKSMEI